MTKAIWRGAPLFALALGACSGTGGTTQPVSMAQSVFAAAGGLSAAEMAASGYEALPACPGTTPCADPAIVAQIKHYDAQAYNALQPLVAAAQAGGSVIDAVQFEAAQAALSAFTGYLAQHGVK